MNIPIYRAKKIDSDEWVEGDLFTQHGGAYILKDGENNECMVDFIPVEENTLAIHFLNMIDKNGKKIFASLNEDGVGGDIVRHKNSQKENGFNEFTVIYDNWQIRAMNKTDGKFGFKNAFGNEVVGIYKGE